MPLSICIAEACIAREKYFIFNRAYYSKASPFKLTAFSYGLAFSLDHYVGRRSMPAMTFYSITDVKWGTRRMEAKRQIHRGYFNSKLISPAIPSSLSSTYPPFGPPESSLPCLVISNLSDRFKLNRSLALPLAVSFLPFGVLLSRTPLSVDPIAQVFPSTLLFRNCLSCDLDASPRPRRPCHFTLK